MALSESTLSGMMQANLTTEGFNITSTGNATPPQPSWMPVFCDAIAKAVVDHIKAAGKANVTAGSSTGQWPIV